MTNGGMKKMSNKLPLMYHNQYGPDETLADIAEKWWVSLGNKPPKRGTKEWEKMYKKWHLYAFQDFR